MISKPLVSVLMITYHHEKFLEQAVESIVSQQCDFPFELIIGDDGSKDATWELARALKVKYPDLIRLLRHQPNVGMNENLRLVALAARGEYLAFCEGDDFWSSTEKLSKQVASIRQESGVSLVYSDFGRCFEWQNAWFCIPSTIPAEERKQVDIPLVQLLMRMSIHLSAALCRSDLVRDYFASSHYNPGRSLGDVPLFLYLATRGRVLYVDGSFSVYRQHPASATNQSRQGRLKIVQDHVKVVGEFCDRYVLSREDTKRVRRASRSRLAAAAYSTGSLPVFFQNLDWLSPKDILRSLLIMAPRWHRRRLEGERERQLATMLSGSRLLN